MYAIEKNPEGIELIRKNVQKLRTDNVQIVEGTAPEALRKLEPPTHVFIGGSSGNLREIPVSYTHLLAVWGRIV